MTAPTTDVTRYRIIIRGECGPLLTGVMDNVPIEPSPGGDTCVIAAVRDDAEFWGVIERLQDFVLRVVSIQDLGAGSDQPARTDAGWLGDGRG